MRGVFLVLTALATIVTSLGLVAPGRAAAPIAKVAIIVGPVGQELTPTYIALADAAAARHGPLAACLGPRHRAAARRGAAHRPPATRGAARAA